MSGPQFSDLLAADDFQGITDLYRALAECLDGRLKLAPAHKRGGADWPKAVPENLEDAPALPRNRGEAERLCVFVDNILACDPATTFLVGIRNGYGSQPAVRQIAGPECDKVVAQSILLRQLGIVPQMVPAVRDATTVPANDNQHSAEEVRALVPTPPMHPDPFTPEAAGGLLGDTARWITSTAIIPVPELSLASALALLAGMFGDRCLGPTRTGVNLFLTTFLATGGGKGHPPKAIRLLADLSGRPGAVTNGDPTSYAALERILRRNRSTVVIMDEFGITLQDMNSRHKTAPAASIRKFLLAIYDQAGSKFDGRTYASDETKKDASPIDGPALTALGMTTPETLYSGLSEASISDGFMNQFLFMTGAAPSIIKPPSLNQDGKPPAELIDALQKAVEVFPRPAGNIAGILGSTVVPFVGGEGGEAYKRWGEVFRWQHDNAWTSVERHLNGRTSENTLRLATLRAISRDPAGPAVTTEDVEWGFGVVHRSIAIVHEGVERHMASTPAESLRKAILEALREAKDGSSPSFKASRETRR